MIEGIVAEDLEAALGAAKSRRVGAARSGYRHGSREEEFPRCTKTQASLPGEDAVLLLLFGLLRSGQIVLPRMDCRQDIPKVIV